MAIYHFKAKILTRSQGKGCVASAAYQSRDSFKDERLNQTFNYRHKGDDYQSGFILAPEGAPAWMLKSESLWNGVEAFEDALIYERFRGDHKDPVKRQNSLDAREKALSSAQTAWTTTVALPRELTYKQNEELLRSYLQDQFVKKGLVVQCDIHKDPGNPHAHIMVTMRAVEGDRFAQTKITSQRYLPGEGVTFFSRDHLKNGLRADWAAYANAMLERHGWDVRIDHRTLEEQEVSRLKTDHEGYYARLIEARGGVARICAENREIAAANLNQYLSNPALIINDLAREKVVFSKQDIMTFLQKHAGNNETLFLSLKQALSEVKLPNYVFKSANNNIRFDSEEIKQELGDLLRDGVAYVLKNDALVSLGESLFKHELFTSQEQRQRESATLGLIEQAAENKAVGTLRAKKIEQAIAKSEAKTGFVYSAEQRQTVTYLTSGGQLKVLEGRAGTGKSTVLKPVVEAYQQAGYRVMGAAFQGIIADALATELGIPAHTLDKYSYQWGDTQKARESLRTAKGETKAYLKQKLKKSFFYEPDAKTVFIVDEGSMVKHDHYHKLLEQITKVGAKLIVVQDQHQFKALTGADISAELPKRADAVYLKDVFRQQTPWQREATACLNDHRLEEGLYAYERHNRLHLAANQDKAKAALLKQYLQDFKAYPQERLTILSFENRHVDFFNTQVFNALLQEGHLKDPFTIKGRIFAVGAHVLFTCNDNREEFVQTVEGQGTQKGVKNGSFGVITGYDQATKICAVRLENGRLVRFNTEAYSDLRLGYAITTMKSQGKTVFRSYTYIDQVRSANDMLVSLSRHRDDGFIYASQEQYPSFRELAKAASASQYQGIAEAYAVSAEDKPAYDLVAGYKEASRQVGALGFALAEQGRNRNGDAPYDESVSQAFARAKTEREV